MAALWLQMGNRDLVFTASWRDLLLWKVHIAFSFSFDQVPLFLLSWLVTTCKNQWVQVWFAFQDRFDPWRYSDSCKKVKKKLSTKWILWHALKILLKNFCDKWFNFNLYSLVCGLSGLYGFLILYYIWWTDLVKR